MAGENRKRLGGKTRRDPWKKAGLKPGSTARSIKSKGVVFGKKEERQGRTVVKGLKSYLALKYPGLPVGKESLKPGVLRQTAPRRGPVSVDDFISKYSIHPKLFEILKKDLTARRLWAYHRVTGEIFMGTEEGLLASVQSIKGVSELLREFEVVEKPGEAGMRG